MNYGIFNQNIETLKAESWEKNDENCFNLIPNEGLFFEMTDYHIPTARKSMTAENSDTLSINYLLQYEKIDGKIILFARVFKVSTDSSVEKECLFEDSIQFDDDILGFFPKEEPSVSGDCLEKLLEKDADEIADEIQRLNPEKYEELKKFFNKDIDEEEVARDWISDNTDDAWSIVVDECSDYTIRDFVKDYICDNL